MSVKASTRAAGTGGGPPWLLRAAALLALLAPVAMAVVAAVALAGDAGIAVLAVALVLASTAAIWVALTRRGAARVVAGALAVLATAGLVVVLATHWHGVLVLLALLLLLALFGIFARFALQRSVPTAPAGPVRGSPPSRPAALILNRWSGGGKAERFDLENEARKRGIVPIVLRRGDDLVQLAEGAIDDGAVIVGMAGGDGSQALVATVAARRGVAHVCVPAGTRNHFALDLGLDRDDVVGALDAYDDGIERRIDLARVNDRVFVNNASLGVYAKVVQSDAYRDAKLETWTEMLPEMLGPGAAPIDLEFTGPDGAVYVDAPLILVSNNVYELTHLAGAGTRGRIDAGILGVVAARVRSAGEVSKLTALELVGQAGRFPGLISFSTPEFDVRSHGQVEVGLDGEALVMQPPLRFKSMPGALRVRLPKSAGLAPAARSVALSANNLRALARVAAGR